MRLLGAQGAPAELRICQLKKMACKVWGVQIWGARLDTLATRNRPVCQAGTLIQCIFLFSCLGLVSGERQVASNSQVRCKMGSAVTGDGGLVELLQAAHKGDLARVMELHALGANLDACDEEGWSALIEAAKGGQLQMTKELLRLGAAPNPSKVVHTALRGAAIFGHADIVEELLRAGADPNLVSLHDRTPLMGAAMKVCSSRVIPLRGREQVPGYCKAASHLTCTHCAGAHKRCVYSGLCGCEFVCCQCPRRDGVGCRKGERAL